MSAGSLRLRLLLAAAAAIFGALAIALVLMTYLFSRHTERRIEAELTRDAMEMIAEIRQEKDGTPRLDSNPADPRFDKPSSGRYWQVSNTHGKLRSLSLWDELLPVIRLPEATHWQSREVDGPFGQRLLVISRKIRLQSGVPGMLVQVGQDMSELRAARTEFRLELGLFLSLLWLVLVAAAWLQVQLGLQPLGKIRKELDSMQKSSTARLGTLHPREISPLIDAINTLAEAREKDLKRARRRAGDLAHSLKTPLSALRAISRRARTYGTDAIADDLDRVLDSASAALEAELARSRAATIRDGARSDTTKVQEISERIVGVLERTEAGCNLVYNVVVPENMQLPLSEEDLMEVLGALAENAVRFARRRILISGTVSGQSSSLAVEDDGSGLNISTEEALMRGGRLDEAGGGNHGLGLAIARDIVEASSGSIELSASEMGGLKVTLHWAEKSPLH